MLCATDWAETVQAESPVPLLHGRDLHLTVVAVKARSTNPALAESAGKAVPEVIISESTDTVDIIRVQHHELTN